MKNNSFYLEPCTGNCCFIIKMTAKIRRYARKLNFSGIALAVQVLLY